MHHPEKWWLGLAPLALVWIGATAASVNRVETDVAARTRQVLAALPADALNEAAAGVQGRDVHLSGAAFTRDGSTNAVAAVDHVFGVRLVDSNIGSLAVAKPYTFAVRRNPAQVILEGNVPTPAARVKALDAAKTAAAGATLVDSMKYAAGAAAGYDGQTVFAVAQASKLTNGAASIIDGAYSIAGEAPTAAAYEEALAATQKLPAGLSLAKVEILPPVAKPYLWSATRTALGVALAGYAPNEAARSAIAAKAAATFAGMKVENTLQIAGGAPNGDFGAATGFALAELSKLSEGAASLRDGQLTIEGTGLQATNNASLAAAARSGLPQGFSIASINVKEAAISPYVFNATKSDGKLALNGYFPDAKSRQDILAAVKSRFAGDAVEDNLKQGAGAPANFSTGAIAALASLSRLSTGSLDFHGVDIVLKGDAFYDNATRQITTAFSASPPQGFKASTALRTKEPGPAIDAAACEPQIKAQLTKGTVQFEVARAEIAAESAALLDRVAGVALRCGNIDIEVAGHTDSDGAAASNKALSQRRAQAVVDYLVNAGLEAGHLSAVGYGEERPIASNDTAEGKAQNRRIEVTVK